MRKEEDFARLEEDGYEMLDQEKDKRNYIL